MNIPNSLTLFRIVLIPVFVVVFYFPYEWKHLVTAAIFGLAALTDLLDGYLARRLDQTSPFGAFLDPVADKIMVAVALVLLVGGHPTPWLAIPAAVIIGREIVVSALREWMAEAGLRDKVAVSALAKFKTTFQMVAILLMLFGKPLMLEGQSLAEAVTLRSGVYTVGFALLYAAALLTLWSMVSYLRAAWPVVAPNAAKTPVDSPVPGTKISSSTAARE